MKRITADGTPGAPGRFSLRICLLISALTAVFCGLAIWMVVPAPPVGFYWDDTWYLLMAEWLSERSAMNSLAWTMLQMRQYPPLFSYALLLVGASLEVQQTAFIMNALFLATAIGVAMAWFVREGLSAAATALAAALLMFNPIALHWLPTLFSEPLFILLTTAALALSTVRRDQAALWLLIGLIAGLSVATRSAGWALAAGMLIHLALRSRFVRIAYFVIGLAVGVLTIPYFMAGLPLAKTYMGEFIRNASSIDWSYFPKQFQGLVDGWQALWGSGIGGLTAAVFVLPGLAVRLKQNRPDAWYVVVYLAMLIAWPFPQHMSRFLWPLLPAFLLALNSSVALFRYLRHTHTIAGVVIALILALSIPAGIGRSFDRLMAPPAGELFALSRMPEWTRASDRQTGMEILAVRRQLLDDMRQIAHLSSSNSCVYSELPSLVTVHTRQVSIASPWNTLGAVDHTEIRCPYYYMIPLSLPGTRAADVEDFGVTHRELFRSQPPGDPESDQPLGVFFELRPPATE